MKHQYRIRLPTELFFTMESNEALTQAQIQERTEQMIGDDGFLVARLPEGVVYHPGHISPEVYAHVKGKD